MRDWIQAIPLFGIQSGIAGIVFYFIAGSAIESGPFAPGSRLRKFGCVLLDLAKLRVLYMAASAALLAASLTYAFAVHHYEATEAADDGVRKVFARRNEPGAGYLTLNVPKSFRYQNRDTLNYMETELQLVVYYPDLASPRDPQYLDRGYGCEGDCPLSVTIIYAPSSLFGDVLDNQVENFKHWRARTLRNESPPDGFSEELYAPSPNEKLDDVLLTVKNSDGRHNLLLECEPKQYNPSCSLSFVLSCDREVRITVSLWPYRRILEALEARRRFESFVAPMVSNAACERNDTKR